jgi:PilZ domain
MGHNSLSERRDAERIFIPFPAVVEGIDAEGNNFKVNTVLDNLSKGGLFLRMVPRVDVGSQLSVIFRLSASVESEATSAKIAINGEVVRIERKVGGACGIALKYNPARFI